MKFLIVSNSSTMRRILIAQLKRAGYDYNSDFYEARDVIEALSKIDPLFTQSIVITDFTLPYGDAVALATTIRSDQRIAKMKILLMATILQTEEIKQARAAGVDDYIVKPFTPTAISDKLISMLPYLIRPRGER